MEDSTIHETDFKDALNHIEINKKQEQPECEDRNFGIKKRHRQSPAQHQQPGMIHLIFEKVDEISDKITDFLPAWARMIGKLQEMTGYRKRCILLAMVKEIYFFIV